MIKDFLDYKRIRNGVLSLTDKFIRGLGGITLKGQNTTTGDEECRPDKVAYKWFGNPRHDWVILKFNGISNPYSFNRNFNYRVPELSEFYSKLGYLSSEEPTVQNTIEKNIINKQFNVDKKKIFYNKKKSVTDKRQPGIGTRIIGDKLIFEDNANFGTPVTNENKPIITPEQPGTVELTCRAICDIGDPELCKLCTCKPKASDVLNYKLLQNASDETTTDTDNDNDTDNDTVTRETIIREPISRDLTGR